MNNKESRFEWKDYVNRSALCCGDKHIATVDYNEAIGRGFMLQLSVEHTHYHNHNLNAANLDEAKQKAEEIIAAEYEKVIAHARAKFEEYKELASGLTELQLSKGPMPEEKIFDESLPKFEFIYVSPYGLTERVTPKINCYANNNNLYLGLDYFGNDMEDWLWLPYCDVTVNVGKLPYLESAIDTNNNGTGIIAFLEKNGFGHLTGRSIKSGFCVFPVFKFNEDKLKEVDSDNFVLYAKAHGRDLRSLDDTIKEAREQAVAEAGDNKDKIKESSLEETR